MVSCIPLVDFCYFFLDARLLAFFWRAQVEANHVFILEPLLNAAVEAQAVNRVHRGGQRRPTTIHRLVVLGTIEEDIARYKRPCCD